jgi:hypothetical protein
LLPSSEVLIPPKDPNPSAKAVSGFAADVYSFGVVVWEVATGSYPYNGKSLHEIILMVDFEKQHLPIMHSRFQNRASPFLVSIMENCWYNYPESRITFQELDQKFSTLG